MKNFLLSSARRRGQQDRGKALGKAAWLLALACAATGLPAPAAAETFAVLSYNVRGIPPPAIEDRTAEIEQIAPLLEDFHTEGDEYEGIASVVGLQELFFDEYYKILFDMETVSYPFFTEKDEGGPAMIGDGLNLLSDFKFDDFKRVQWEDCFGSMGAAGSDCDTNKGYSYARVQLVDEIFFDLYTLHADAGQDEGSREARRANTKQLIDGIADLSTDGAPVIVLGDTNSLYTRVGDDNL